jgi:hypothetical protein
MHFLIPSLTATEVRTHIFKVLADHIEEKWLTCPQDRHVNPLRNEQDLESIHDLNTLLLHIPFGYGNVDHAAD